MAEQPALEFAGLLRQLRAEARLTQEELAEAAGVSPRSVSDLERGINRTARKDTALLLAGALGLALSAALVAGVTVAVLPLSSAAAATPTSSAPVRIGPSGMSSVSCPTTTFCMAVGGNPGNAATYRNGTWSAPKEIDGLNALFSVSCPTSTFCVAGDAHGYALTYRNGTWSAPEDVDGTNSLFSVSCSSATFCAAVDSYGQALTFNGTTWSITSIDESTVYIFSVSCLARTFCMATDSTGQAFTYNGSTWSAPNAINGGLETSFHSVSCPARTFCMAVGTAGTAFFNGSTWSAPASIDLANGLYSVSCPTTTFCVAIDGEGNTFTRAAPGPRHTMSMASASPRCLARPGPSAWQSDVDGNAITYRQGRQRHAGP